MKYTVNFPAACPFAAHMRYSNAQARCFVRTVNNVEYAARKVEGIKFRFLTTDDTRHADGLVAEMIFSDNNDNYWTVKIYEHE